MKLQKEDHYEWQKENFKAYAFARSAKKKFWINTQVEHAKWQKENFEAYAFARSAKNIFWKSCRPNAKYPVSPGRNAYSSPSAKYPSFGLAKHLIEFHERAQAQNIPALAWRSAYHKRGERARRDARARATRTVNLFKKQYLTLGSGKKRPTGKVFHE